jgi:hypothetical protein
MRINSDDGGLLLTLSYLLYEIYRIGNALISTTEYSKRLSPLRKPLIDGIQFRDNLHVSSFYNYLHDIPVEFKLITQKYLESEHKKTINQEGVVIEVNEYQSLSNTTIKHCIEQAQACLRKLIKLNSDDKYFLDYDIDMQFNIFVRFKPKVTPRFKVIFDASLLDDFKHLNEYLKTFFNMDNPIEPFDNDNK